MDKNGFEKTKYADGEWVWPDANDVALEMVRQGIVNTYLNDIHAYGITNWIKVMPIIKNAKADGSPHAWGDQLKHITQRIWLPGLVIYRPSKVSPVSQTI